jgi:hypothetical protein
MLAWAFDIGPGGVHRTASIDDPGVDHEAHTASTHCWRGCTERIVCAI